MPRADWDFLKRQKIRIPSENLLKEFQSKIDPILSMLKLTSEANRKLEQTRNLLLPRLISGKLSIEDLDIQFPPSMMESEKEITHA